MAGEYRIRWANVPYRNGRSFSWERMCIGERRHWLFGWWPVLGANWHGAEQWAERDIERDSRLREPPPAPRIVKPRNVGEQGC